MSKLSLVSLLIAAIGVCTCRTARAQDSCSVTSSSFSFGEYDPFSPAPVDSTGQVQVACTDGTAYQVYLNAGLHSSGSFFPRKMKHGSLSWYLTYNHYTDAARTQVWGDGTGGTTYINGTGQGIGSQITHTVYGRIPALQNVYVGFYSDTITVTVQY